MLQLGHRRRNLPTAGARPRSTDGTEGPRRGLGSLALPRAPIIALVGVDGAGKTTQAALLADELAGRGVRVSRFHNPAGRRSLGRLAERLGRSSPADLLGRRGRLAVETWIRWWRIAAALVVARATGRVAVMDRYTCCQLALMRVRGDPGQRLVRRLFGRFPHPDLVCFLAVSPRLAAVRVSDRAIDAESVEDLSALDAAYRALPEFPTFRVVDADREPLEVRDALRALVAEVLPTAR